jgi:NADPH:quinone reductase-like Zn-dependent oxidoreductase
MDHHLTPTSMGSIHTCYMQVLQSVVYQIVLWNGVRSNKPCGKIVILLVRKLLEEGKIVPVIDRRYPFGETAEAIRYLEEGHDRGKVVITV